MAAGTAGSVSSPDGVTSNVPQAAALLQTLLGVPRCRRRGSPGTHRRRPAACPTAPDRARRRRGARRGPAGGSKGVREGRSWRRRRARRRSRGATSSPAARGLPPSQEPPSPPGVSRTLVRASETACPARAHGRRRRKGCAVRRASRNGSSAPPGPDAARSPGLRRAPPTAGPRRRRTGAASRPRARRARRRGATPGRTTAGRGRWCSPPADPAREKAERLRLLGLARAVADPDDRTAHECAARDALDMKRGAVVEPGGAGAAEPARAAQPVPVGAHRRRTVSVCSDSTDVNCTSIAEVAILAAPRLRGRGRARREGWCD